MKRQSGEPSARTASSLLRLRGYRLVSSLLLSSWIVLGAAGCAKTPDKPPESALKQAKKDSRLDHQEELDLERRHLAPPPAYGNKVVMAQEEHTATHRF